MDKIGVKMEAGTETVGVAAESRVLIIMTGKFIFSLSVGVDVYKCCLAYTVLINRRYYLHETKCRRRLPSRSWFP